MPTFEEVKAIVEQYFTSATGLAGFSADTPETEAPIETPDLGEVDRETYLQALNEVGKEHGVPEETRGEWADKLDADGDYSPQALLDHLNLVVNDTDAEVDQSAHIDGEVHSDVWQENDSNVANANGEGSIAGEYVYDNQIQTGDGQQVGGDSGVQNQGDNSGQQAGWGNAEADNVTTGDGNTVGSDWASRVGAGQVSQDGAYINDSAQAFGEGSATNEANDTYDSHDTYTETATATDSFNSNYEDNDTQTQTIETHGDHGGYEPDYHDHGHDDYDHGHDHGGDDIHQHAEIIED